MWNFFRKTPDHKKVYDKNDKEDPPLDSKKSDIFSISDFPERMSENKSGLSTIKRKRK